VFAGLYGQGDEVPRICSSSSVGVRGVMASGRMRVCGSYGPPRSAPAPDPQPAPPSAGRPAPLLITAMRLATSSRNELTSPSTILNGAPSWVTSWKSRMVSAGPSSCCWPTSANGPGPGDRIRGEDDAGHRRIDHPLDDHRRAHLVPAEAEVRPIGGCSLVVQRIPAVRDRCQQLGVAAHVEIGVLLTGKAGLGQVLRGRAGADRDRPYAERTLGFEHRLPGFRLAAQLAVRGVGTRDRS
jgi:hypothetical protein